MGNKGKSVAALEDELRAAIGNSSSWAIVRPMTSHNVEASGYYNEQWQSSVYGDSGFGWTTRIQGKTGIRIIHNESYDSAAEAIRAVDEFWAKRSKK